MIVVDTGPLYAAADTSDAHHAACAALFSNPPDQLVVPVSVLVETSFLIERHLGPSPRPGSSSPSRPPASSSSNSARTTCSAWPSSSPPMPTYRSAP
jgi:predicted nucleic acid-binding protein